VIVRVALALLLAFTATANPRPIDTAEREAVAAVAAFLAEGPAALYARLATDAPLRAIPKEDALRELAVRTGPTSGATWSLQTVDGSPHDVAFRVTFPSGYEDGLLFRMKQEGPRWTIRELLTLAEEPDRRPPVARTVKTVSFRVPLLIAAGVIGLIGIALLSRLRILAIAALSLSAAALAAAWLDPVQRAVNERPTTTFAELRALLPLREALARGDDAQIPANISSDARDVAILWLLESGVPVDVPGNDQDPVGGLRSVTKTQSAEIVRARIALSEDKEELALRHFERAVAMRPLRDDILVEAVTSFGGAAGQRFLTPERVRGSRDAVLYYARAKQASANGKLAEAQQHLAIAWALQPMAREELVREPRLFALVRDAQTSSLVSLLSAAEPARRSESLGRTPVALPAAAQAFVTGDLLRVEVNGAALEVSGGAALAPANARLVPATYRQKQQDAAALRDAQSLLELPARATSPASRRRVVRAALALANHNRWPDVVRLTEDITPRTASVAPDLLVLRMRALLRADRVADARALAEGDAVTELGLRRQVPATLLAIADAMATRGQWDTAMSLFGTVRAQEFSKIVDTRRRQVELRRALVADGKTISTAHFDIRHDPSMNPAIASRIGDLLEAEIVRLQKKLPPVQPRRVAVNVLHWETFRGDVTGSDHILGLYDGEILFPFAIVNRFKPEVVAIITHELTHALLAQATGDNAPRWFQEGTAQRMELVPVHPNPFASTAAEQVLPVSLLDAMMENATDTYALEHGYHVAHAFIRFLESRNGNRAIATLAAEFAKGKNTDDALLAVTGKSVDDLNQEFRAWGFANSGPFTNAERFPYDALYSPGIDPRIREGFKWGKKP